MPVLTFHSIATLLQGLLSPLYNAAESFIVNHKNLFLNSLQTILNNPFFGHLLAKPGSFLQVFKIHSILNKDQMGEYALKKGFVVRRVEMGRIYF